MNTFPTVIEKVEESIDLLGRIEQQRREQHALAVAGREATEANTKELETIRERISEACAVTGEALATAREHLTNMTQVEKTVLPRLQQDIDWFARQVAGFSTAHRDTLKTEMRHQSRSVAKHLSVLWEKLTERDDTISGLLQKLEEEQQAHQALKTRLREELSPRLRARLNI